MPSYSPVFSAQFVVVQGGSPLTPFYVPSGFTAVIRDFTGYSAAGGFIANVSIRNSLIAPPVVGPWIEAAGVPAYQQWQGRVVVPEGGEIDVYVTSFIDEPDIYVGGYLLRNTLS